jgi:hypothetical protein
VFLRRKIGGLEFLNKTGIIPFNTLFEMAVYKSVMVNTNIIIQNDQKVSVHLMITTHVFLASLLGSI